MFTGTFSQITVELLIDTMDDSLDFYCEELGFAIDVQVPEEGTPFFATIKKDVVKIMLYARQQFSEEIPAFTTQKRGGTIALYISADKIEELFNQLSQKHPIIQPLHQTNYGSTEFSMTDPSGYVLMFASPS
jgi:uncharacterized glyoxalase superfamily protein PhnB